MRSDVTAGAPDITEVETDRQSASVKRAPVSVPIGRAARVTLSVSSAIFVITATVTFGGALALNNSRPHAIPVVRVPIAAPPPPTVPVVSTPAPPAVKPQKTKSIDEVSAYDEIPHRHVRKPRKNESAAYDPRRRTGRLQPNGQTSIQGMPNNPSASDSSDGLGKNPPQRDRATASPPTNW